MRGFDTIQQVAISGRYGKVPNKVNFFESLTNEELRRELIDRGLFNFPSNKQGRLHALKGHLRGVQRVPALLLLNPTIDLNDVNLINYSVLAFEPLHDLKGHIAKLLDRLPGVITSSNVHSKVNQYLHEFFKKLKIYGSDL